MNTSERRHNTWNKIFRKLRIIKAKGEATDKILSQPHRLNKDKVEKRSTNAHTNNKTKRHIHGNYQKSKNYTKHDQQQIDFMEYEEVE